MSMSVELRGHRGPKVLLLHGMPGSKATWSRVASLLAPGARIFIPDLLGFGVSPPYRRDGHAEEQAEALLTMCHGERIERVHVVGFDFGGPTAVAMYRLAAERVASLTLVATNLFTDTPVPPPLRVARVPGLGAAVFRLLFGTWGLAAMWAVATRDRHAFRFRDFAPVLASAMGVRSTRRLFLLSLRDLRRLYAEVEATLPSIAVPSTVVWGDSDPFFAPQTGRRTAAAIPGARFLLLPGCGHFVPGERSEALAAAIAATVEAGERRGRATA